MNNQTLQETFCGKRILITGGTGSFGRQIVSVLTNYDPASIHVYSRDEKKQYDMAKQYTQFDNLHFIVGDVRDYDRVNESMRGIDIVFNAAALKQVPSCEYAPFEDVKTNILGAKNVRDAAIANEIDTVISVSTDKAVKPVNVMGMTKAVQERVMLTPSVISTHTKFICVRYGNVLGSRGSVVPYFCERIRAELPLPITNSTMTRFQLTLDESVKLVLRAALEGNNGDLWVRKMPAANIVDLARALSFGITGRDNYPVEMIGIRPGEKIHEVLVSEEEMWRAKEIDDYFSIKGWSESETEHTPKQESVMEYSSDRTHLMSVTEIDNMLRVDGWISKEGFGFGDKHEYV